LKDREVVEERPDGMKVVTQKGTLRMLDEWIAKYYRPGVPSRFRTCWRRSGACESYVSHLRHAVREDDFDQKYFKDQRELALQVYDGIRAVRLMLDPFNPLTQSLRCVALVAARRFDEAIEQCRNALRTAPGSPVAVRALSQALYETQRYDELLDEERLYAMRRGDRDQVAIIQPERRLNHPCAVERD
jgi:hypothetical protein